jgi:hypothetical protein
VKRDTAGSDEAVIFFKKPSASRANGQPRLGALEMAAGVALLLLALQGSQKSSISNGYAG